MVQEWVAYPAQVGGPLFLQRHFRPDTGTVREGPGYDLPRTARGSRLAEAYAHDAVRLIEIAPEVDLSLWPSINGVLRPRAG